MADESVVTRGNFLPGGRAVPTGNGWIWVADAWALFRAAPGTWLAIVVVLMVIFIALTIAGLIGAVASFVLGPVFIGGLMIASRNAEEGRLQFGDAFAGFRHRFGTLAGVGAIYLAGTLAIFFVSSLVTGVGLFALLTAATSPEALLRAGLTLALTLLVALALMLPLVMALWFAAPLAVFHDMGAGEAMKASFAGCAKNMLPFLLYGIVLAIASAIATIPMLLGWLLLGPVIAASVYTSYRDIYFTEA